MVIKIGKASIPTVHWDLAHETDQRSGRHFEGILCPLLNRITSLAKVAFL